MKRKSIARFQQEFRGARIPAFVGLNLLVRLFPVIAFAFMAIGIYHLVGGSHDSHSNLLMAGAGPVLVPAELKDQLEKGLKGLKDDLGSFADDAKKELKTLGKETEETKGRLDKTLTEIADFRERIKGIEDKLSKSSVFGGGEVVKSIGAQVIESEGYKGLASGRTSTGKISLKGVSFSTKTAIVNATGQNQPLVPALRVPGIIEPLRQRLFIRDLLNVVPTTANSIEFAKETSSTNAAAPQGKGSSPQVYENVAKAESALGFTLAHEPVQTVAHWIPTSRQVLDDAPALGGYIDGRMRYFQALKVEAQLLNGTAAGGDLNGLVTQATAYDTSYNQVGDTVIDKLRHYLLQVELANAYANLVVLNPKDWHDIELLKTTGTASSGEYIFANPHNVGTPMIWGRNVVPTQSMTAAHTLVGDTQLAADLYDRQSASVEVSREHSDFFVKNMVAILCEERLALVVYRPEALVYGAL